MTVGVLNRNAVAPALVDFSEAKWRNRLAVENHFFLLSPGLPKRQPWAGGRSPCGASAKAERWQEFSHRLLRPRTGS